MTSIIPTGYKKLVSDIVRLYESARKAQVELYWQIGQRIVEVEQGGANRAPHNSGILKKLSEDLIAKNVIKIVAKSPTDPTKHYVLL